MWPPSWKTIRWLVSGLLVTLALFLITRHLISLAERQVIEKSIQSTEEGKSWWKQVQQYIAVEPGTRALWIGRVGRAVAESAEAPTQLIALEFPAPIRVLGSASAPDEALYISLRENGMHMTERPEIGEIWCVAGKLGEKRVIPYSLRRYQDQ